MVIALTIAGSDPSGGAGLQADLKTFHQHGVYGCSVVTLLTVQNTLSVHTVHLLPTSFVAAQLDAVLSDLPPQAAKTGALADAGVIRAVAQRAMQFPCPLVVDPVMISKHGDALLDKESIHALMNDLLPLAMLATPNTYEAEALSGIKITSRTSAENAARAIGRLGPANVLIKGVQAADGAVDLLWIEGRPTYIAARRIDTGNTHGTGCALTAAITARLALGENLEEAVRGAKAFVTEGIRTNPGFGSGCGPINLFASPRAPAAPA